jgi:hypothetical protein
MDQSVTTFAQGWLVEVGLLTAPEGPSRRLYVVALPNADEATAAVRRLLGGQLPYEVEPKCRFSPRALVRLGAHPGQILQIRSTPRRKVRATKAPISRCRPINSSRRRHDE